MRFFGEDSNTTVSPARFPSEPGHEDSDSHRWLILSTVFCVPVFAISWALWFFVWRSTDVDLHFHLRYQSFDLSRGMTLGFVGNFAPGLVALVLGAVTGWRYFADPLTQLRVPPASKLQVLFSILTPVALVLLTALVQENMDFSAFRDLSLFPLLRLFLLNIPLAPFWEELGWRGCLLPILTGRFGIWRGSLFLGVIWAAWHLVLYLCIFHTSLESYGVSFIAITGMSIIVSALYGATRKNLWLPVIFHCAWNSTTDWVGDAVPDYGMLSILIQAGVVWFVAGMVWLWWGGKETE
jgi:membrane protease YdiL (CAAX protease family)